MNDSAPRQIPIPINFSGGINILGMSLKIRNVIEGIAFGGILAVISYAIVNFFATDTATIIGFTLTGGMLGLIGGLVGYNGDPLSKFILYLIKFSKCKRVCYYNSRVKFEASEQFNSMVNSYKNIGDTVLPRDKIMAFVNNRRTHAQEEQLQAVDGNKFFEDDIGYVTPPQGYTVSSNRKKEKAKANSKNSKRSKNNQKLKKKQNKSARRKK